MGVDWMMIASEAKAEWEAIKLKDVFGGSNGLKSCRLFGRSHDSLNQLWVISRSNESQALAEDPVSIGLAEGLGRANAGQGVANTAAAILDLYDVEALVATFEQRYFV